MKQWIRWWGLGVFFTLAVVWWLCIDSLIKYSIETAGTQAVGAKVELDNANLSLIPIGLTLNGLAITNPDQPMQNLWYSDSINLDINSSHLLRRQLIVEHADIAGLQFNNARKYSGAIDNKAYKNNNKNNNKTPSTSNSLPDPTQLIAQEKDAITAKFNKIETDLKAIEKQWDKRLDELPNEQDLAHYKKRWKALKKKGWLEKISDTKALQKDIKKDLADIDDLDDQLKKDQNKVGKLLNKAKNLPEKEADRLLAKAGYSGGSREIAKTLFGDEAKQWVQKITGLFQSASTPASTEQQTPRRGKGQWISFNELNPHPDLLIKQAKLSGHFNILGESIGFTGDAKNLTHQPQRWKHPAEFTLIGSSKTGATFNSQGSIDLRAAPFSKMAITFDQLSIKKLILSTSDSFPINLDSSTLSGTGKLEIKGEVINLNTSTAFTNTQFKTDAGSNTTEKIIAATLAEIDQFNLKLNMGGNISDPQLSIKSDLDKALSGSFKKQAANELASYKTKLTQGLNDEMGGQLNGLTKEASFLNDINKQLSDKKEAVNGLSKGLL